MSCYVCFIKIKHTVVTLEGRNLSRLQILREIKLPFDVRRKHELYIEVRTDVFKRYKIERLFHVNMWKQETTNIDFSSLIV